MKKYAIIVAGGKGNRFKSEVPKQFVNLVDKPVLMHTVEAFFNYDKNLNIIIVLPSEQIDFWKEICKKHSFSIPHEVVEGGKERFFSVKNGLSNIKQAGIVAIHDGVRPLIDAQTLENCFQKAEESGNAIPVVAPVDSMRELSGGKNKHVNRNNYRLIQTPQVFKTDLIINAFEQEFSELFTDDASVLESMMPGCINLVEGNRQNIKITTPEDLIYAEAILQNRY